MTDIDRHPVLKLAHDLCRQIEETLPASKAATDLTVSANRLLTQIENGLVIPLEGAVKSRQKCEGLEFDRCRKLICEHCEADVPFVEKHGAQHDHPVVGVVSCKAARIYPDTLPSHPLNAKRLAAMKGERGGSK